MAKRSSTNRTTTAIASPSLVVPSNITDTGLPEISALMSPCSYAQIKQTRSLVASSSSTSLKASSFESGTAARKKALRTFNLYIRCFMGSVSPPGCLISSWTFRHLAISLSHASFKANFSLPDYACWTQYDLPQCCSIN